MKHPLATITALIGLLALGETPSNVEEVFVGIGIWFAISATVGFQRRVLDPPEE